MPDMTAEEHRAACFKVCDDFLAAMTAVAQEHMPRVKAAADALNAADLPGAFKVAIGVEMEQRMERAVAVLEKEWGDE